MAQINGISVPFIPITQSSEITSGKAQAGYESFGSIFEQELDKLKFSNHALKRLESRNIQLGNQDLNKIQDAVNKAEQKGSKDSLVMMNDTAFIVNIPNRTVVTALPVGETNENVFTNIDSGVVA